MKVCCSSGKPYDTFTEIESMGCYSTDHCIGPMEIEDFDLLLTGLGTFNTNECTSGEELCKLLKTKGEE